MKPNFLHIGAGKTGSTWLHETLIQHPEVYLTAAKDLYFFDRYYHRGQDWYLANFKDAPSSAKVVGEVCPGYLVNSGCAKKIRETLGSKIRLMATLRDPVDRAFSAYLYQVKHGVSTGSFRASLMASPDLLDDARYWSGIRQYLEYFPKENLYLGVFDDLQLDPQEFVNGVTDWLGVARFPLTSEMLTARLPASQARFVPIARAAQRAADWARRHDGANIVGHIKRSSWVQSALYKPLGADRPTVPAEDAQFIRNELEAEIVAVEREFDLPLRDRWGW